MIDHIDMIDSINNIKEALTQRGRPISEFFKGFEKKHGIVRAQTIK